MFESLMSLSRRAMVVMIFMGIVGALDVLLPKIGTATQEQGRVVTKLRRKPMPVDIKVIQTKKGVVELGRNFTAEDDWFKGLKVSVENISGKTIIYIGGGFLFPHPKDKGNNQETPLSYSSFMYGHHPEAPEEARLTQPTISIKPGEIFDITLSESGYNWVKQSLKELGYPASIKEINFNIAEIFFDDGTAWVAGSWYQRDPNNPRKYNRVERTLPRGQSEFKNRTENSFSFVKATFNSTRPAQVATSCMSEDGFYSVSCTATTPSNCWRRKALVKSSVFNVPDTKLLTVPNDECRNNFGLGPVVSVLPTKSM